MDIKPEMTLEIGSEEKFREFIKGIKNYDKVALVSHTDLDGISSPKIINEFILPVKINFVNYMELNQDLVTNLREEGINKIIITDLYIHEEKFIKGLEEFAEILIIDHHESPDWSSEKTTLIKAQGYCATYMCYSLFSKIKNIEKWDWLVSCTCISDYFYTKPKKWLAATMKKYGDHLEIEKDGNMRKSGKFWDLQYTLSLALVYFGENHKEVYDHIKAGKFGDIDDLGKHAKEVRDEINRIVGRFDKEKEKIKEGYLFGFNPKFGVKSIVANIISERDPHKVFIILLPRGDFYTISARRQDRKFDCSKFLENLLKGLKNAGGGGHIPAAGGHFLKKDLPVVRERLGLPAKQSKPLNNHFLK